MRTSIWRACKATARRVAAAVLLAALAGTAGADPLTLDAQSGQVSLDGSGESWMDRSGGSTIDAVAATDGIAWQPTRAGAVYALTSGAALWLRFRVAQPEAGERWYLEIPYPAVDRVTLFTRSPDGGWLQQSAGDLLPVAGWPLPHRHPLLPLLLQPGPAQQFYLRVENTHTFSAPLVFTSEPELLRQEQRAALILGMYFGLAGLAAVLALAAAGWLRDTAFARFSLFVLLTGLSQAALTGIGGLHLWPHWPHWNDISVLALPLLATGALLWFLSGLVSLRQRSARLHKLVVALAALCAVTAAAVLVAERSWRVQVMLTSIVLGILAGSAVVLWAWRRGERYGGLLLAGMLPLAAGAALPLARSAGVLPTSFWTLHSLQLAIAIELPLLLAVLMVRSHDRRENNRRLHGLDRTDPATGLINAQVFEQRLRQLIVRSERLKHQSLVMLVDIVNIEQVRRDWDHGAAEELPLRVAGRLLASAREIDSVARLGDHRFGLLIEGPVAPEELAAQGPKIVARCLMPFEGRPPEWVAQVRVAQALVPGPDDAQSVLRRLAGVLASVPADSKRAVFNLR